MSLCSRCRKRLRKPTPSRNDAQTMKRCHEVGVVCELVIRQGAGHGGWQEMPQYTERMVEWFDLQLLGKQPSKPFTLNISSLPSTPVVKK
jgi:hypothetical protein